MGSILNLKGWNLERSFLRIASEWSIFGFVSMLFEPDYRLWKII